jgi:methylated-DNA-[protein]-cysteine S-methyltransferase
MAPLHYVLLPSFFGTFGVVWREAEKGPKVYQIFLPNHQTLLEGAIRASYAAASNLSCATIGKLGKRIQSFLEGEAVDFELDMMALERCSEFQQRVLLEEHKIPRGWVSTYGRIARRLGVPGGGRAVGRALARNPFPIVIPCHRAIRSDGRLGGFQGGVEMKRALLENEGVEFTQGGKVLMKRIYYGQQEGQSGVGCIGQPSDSLARRR